MTLTTLMVQSANLFVDQGQEETIMLKNLVIIGAGALGRSAIEIAEAMNLEAPSWNILGFLDDDKTLRDRQVIGYSILGNKQWLENHKDVFSCIALGSPALRKKTAEWLAENGYLNVATLIHPSAVISKRSTINEGSIISPGVAIDTLTQVGSHVVLNRNCSLGHDVSVGNYVNISPSATLTGNDLISEGCIIGSNATVIPEKKIGKWSIVGAGSVVNKDLPDRVTAVGVPARVIKQAG